MYPNISRALNISIENVTSSSNDTDCVVYPDDDLVFRADTPTLIDITISVFVVGNYLFLKN